MTSRITKRRSALIMVCVAFFLVCSVLIPGQWYPVESKNGQSCPKYEGSAAIDPSRHSFIIIGDTRGKSPLEFWLSRTGESRASIVGEIVKRQPAFVINLGDLVYKGGSKGCWQEFDEIHAGIRRERIPYFPIIGNHELQGGMEAGLREYFGRFPHLEHRRWYSMTWRNIGFIMLDSNVSALDAKERENQMRWYRAELESFERNENIDSVIVCTHEPPFTNRVKTPIGPDTTRIFADPFLAYRKTSLFFSGHVHSYERFKVGSKHFIVSGGAGAPMGKVVIDRAKRKHEDQFPGGALRFFHLCALEVNADSLALKVLRLAPDGSFSEADGLTVPLKVSRPLVHTS